jgi:hypothetical protein
MWQRLVDANDLQADLDLDNDVDFKDYAGLADTWLDVLLWPLDSVERTADSVEFFFTLHAVRSASAILYQFRSIFD